MKPMSIRVKDGFLSIKWDDNSLSEIKLLNLRYYCPCAFCENDRIKKGDSFIPLYNDNQITIANILNVGKYALKIIWKDGHDAGIYEYEYLKNFRMN